VFELGYSDASDRVLTSESVSDVDHPSAKSPPKWEESRATEKGWGEVEVLS